MIVVHNELVAIESQIAAIDNTLDKKFPDDKLKQLPKEGNEKRKAAVANAFSLEGKILTGGMKLSETRLESNVGDLLRKARDVRSKINEQERAYNEFISTMNQELARDTNLPSKNIKGNIKKIDKWKKLAIADSDKVKRLEGLKAEFNALRARLGQLQQVKIQLRNIIKGLKNTNKAALKQYPQAVKRAESFTDVELQSLLQEAEIEKEAADKKARESKKKEKTQREVLVIVGEMRKFLHEPDKDKKKVEDNILRHINVLRKDDAEYARDLDDIFKILQKSFTQRQKT